MIGAALLAVAAVLAGGVATALAVRFVPAIRAQLVLLTLAAALLPAAAVVVAGLVMFSAHDLLVLALLGAVSAATAGALAAILATRIARPLTRVSEAADALAAGDMTVRIDEAGPAEVRAVAAAFNDMAASLARLFDTRRNLVAWASHDLRAPLASLQAMIEALEDGLAEPADYLAEMRSQVRTLSRLVDDLFELSRIETGTLNLALMDVPLGELAAQCVRSVRPAADKHHVRVALTGEGASARCDPDKTERVLLNLLTNALRHTPEDGSIHVHIASTGADVTVAVEDTGDGLPADALEHAFDSFWRADSARSMPGAGLGLAIARGFVEAQGGRIWAENRPGGGARVSFTVPAAAS